MSEAGNNPNDDNQKTDGTDGTADFEPLTADDPLCKIPGIVLTPHIAWRTDGAYIGLTKQVVQSITAFFKGEDFNVVV